MPMDRRPPGKCCNQRKHKRLQAPILCPEAGMRKASAGKWLRPGLLVLRTDHPGRKGSSERLAIYSGPGAGPHPAHLCTRNISSEGLRHRKCLMSAGLNQKHVILFQKQNVKRHKLNPTLRLSSLSLTQQWWSIWGEHYSIQRMRWLDGITN